MSGLSIQLCYEPKMALEIKVQWKKEKGEEEKKKILSLQNTDSVGNNNNNNNNRQAEMASEWTLHVQGWNFPGIQPGQGFL